MSSSAGWSAQVSHAGCCPALPAIGRRHKLSKEGKKASGNLDGLPSPSAPVGAWPATAAVSCLRLPAWCEVCCLGVVPVSCRPAFSSGRIQPANTACLPTAAPACNTLPPCPPAAKVPIKPLPTAEQEHFDRAAAAFRSTDASTSHIFFKDLKLLAVRRPL